MFLFGGYEFPQLQLVNLGQITTADPYFDSAGFLSFAQGAYWQIHQAAAAGDLQPVRNMVGEAMLPQLESAMGQPIWRTPIQSLEQAAITNVAHDAWHDTVTVRIGAKSTAAKKNDLVEDWTFQRPSSNYAESSSAPPVTQCPSCGAPVSTDESGDCRYCHVPIKGVVGDWRLVSTAVPTIPKASKSGGGCLSGYVIFILLVTVVLPLMITGVVLYEVNKTTDSAFNSVNNGFPFNNVSTTTVKRTGSPGSASSLDGTMTLTGGLTGTMSPSTLSTPDGDSGTCTARAASVTGVNFTANVTNSDAGLQQQLILTVAFPPGAKGPGGYENADVKMVLHETALSGAANVNPEDNTWASGAGSAASVTLSGNDSGSVTFAGLVPTDPNWQKLGGTLTFTCS